MEIYDIVGLKKPLSKLIDCLENGCSWCFKPIQIKRFPAPPSRAVP